MPDGRLKRAARSFDLWLKAQPAQACLQGDANPGNFFFVRREQLVSGLDFQYAGVGHVVKDIAYLFYIMRVHMELEPELLAHYHSTLASKLAKRMVQPPSLEHLNVSLVVANADLWRFFKYRKNWGRRLALHANSLLDSLDEGHMLESEGAYVIALFALHPAPQLLV